MKIAILGGSFNPIHVGHAMLADTIVKELGYDKVLFVPTCIPPHKEIAGGVSTEHRLGMVNAFCNSVPGNCFEVETCEVDRGGVSYTIDTLKYIVEKYKGQLDAKPALLMGEEIAAEFHKWKAPDEIVKLADLIIVPRYPDYFGSALPLKDRMVNKPQGNYEGDFKVKFNKSSFGYACKVLDIPMLPVSSTEIRARVASDRSFQYLVPPAVFDYIKKETLYRWISTEN